MDRRSLIKVSAAIPVAGILSSSKRRKPRLHTRVINDRLKLMSGRQINITVGNTVTNSAPPPSGGFFASTPIGTFGSLPDDQEAADMVTRSTWEKRTENTTANNTMAPTDVFTFSNGYSGMLNHAAVFGRVTGRCPLSNPTTDELIQWACAKWGWPDEVTRAECIRETFWYQNRKDGSGNPIEGQGYGDFGSCTPGSPTPSGYGTGGPSSFGLLQDKWCQLRDAGDSYAWGPWPWCETSTAYALDLTLAVLRGCYEGYDTWLGGSYAAGDMWGCLGRWYSGLWHSPDAETYIAGVQTALSEKVWLTW